MGVEATQMGAEPAAHGRLLWATGGGRRYISYDALRGTLCCAPGQGCPTTTAASAPPPTPTPAAASPSPTVARTTLPRIQKLRKTAQLEPTDLIDVYYESVDNSSNTLEEILQSQDQCIRDVLGNSLVPKAAATSDMCLLNTSNLNNFTFASLISKDMDDHLMVCRFLPKLNDEILGERNALYKERLSSLENLVLIMVIAMPKLAEVEDLDVTVSLTSLSGGRRGGGPRRHRLEVAEVEDLDATVSRLPR
ncbi:hypothetical protein TRIUR3_26898 [Triticum urartu]|uniref:Uncharacterized protein n=1 Tax=Triticum urartu TaxID=4572 RepID=M7Z9L6_TRIUA|nr:hypothetical protein TRIUR3_26898 [Triticum urartu]